MEEPRTECPRDHVEFDATVYWYEKFRDGEGNAWAEPVKWFPMKVMAISGKYCPCADEAAAKAVAEMRSAKSYDVAVNVILDPEQVRAHSLAFSEKWLAWYAATYPEKAAAQARR